MMISLSASGIIVPPLIYGFPRHISTISPLLALIGDKKPGCFAWCMNTEFIVSLLINRGWLNIQDVLKINKTIQIETRLSENGGNL
jgi:hypothetical protein